MTTPIAFSHVGISVPDAKAAIEWYSKVFGWYHIAGPMPIPEGRSPFSDELYGRNGKHYGGFKLAHMSTADHVGIELLEFQNGYDPEDDFDYERHGVFHFAVQTPDVEALRDKVVENGGEIITSVNTMPCTDIMGHTVEYKNAFCKDPFGNIFEIYSYSYELQGKLPTKMG
ncbi:MAG: VOC family protein [Mogibacterium sp.]|nr:VOC family protein [Mogibacterium sp.]